ncbi:MAG TPA: hypothetical protein VIK89_10740 [Cytophagaceae bacterium]
MKRKLTNFAVFALAILFADLLHAYVESYLHHWKEGQGKYMAVAISMSLTVIVFYPIFHFLDKYIELASKKYIEGAKKISGGTITGLAIGFSIALFALFAAFAQVWYNKNVLADLGIW